VLWFSLQFLSEISHSKKSYRNSTQVFM